MSVKNIFDTAALEIIAEIQARMASADANATGKTSRSLESETTDETLRLLGASAFSFVETGRRAGKRPPIDPIREWVEARGLASGPAINGVAYAVAQSIANRGSLTFRTGGNPRDIYSSVVNELRVKTIIDRIESFKIASAQSQIVKSFQDKNIKLV